MPLEASCESRKYNSKLWFEYKPGLFYWWKITINQSWGVGAVMKMWRTKYWVESMREWEKSYLVEEMLPYYLYINVFFYFHQPNVKAPPFFFCLIQGRQRHRVPGGERRLLHHRADTACRRGPECHVSQIKTRILILGDIVFTWKLGTNSRSEATSTECYVRMSALLI